MITFSYYLGISKKKTIKIKGTYDMNYDMYCKHVYEPGKDKIKIKIKNCEEVQTHRI